MTKMSEWRSQGKQVLQDGRHFADAAGELEAMMIVNAMRGIEARIGLSGQPMSQSPIAAITRRIDPRETGKREGTASRRTIYHHVRRENDEMVCSCGARWDVADAAPYAH